MSLTNVSVSAAGKHVFGGIDQDKLNRASKFNCTVVHKGRFGECRSHWTYCCCGAGGSCSGVRLFVLDTIPTLKSNVPKLPTSKRRWEVQIGEDIVFACDGWGAQQSVFLVHTFWMRMRQELGRGVWAEPSALQQLLVLEELKELLAALHIALN